MHFFFLPSNLLSRVDIEIIRYINMVGYEVEIGRYVNMVGNFFFLKERINSIEKVIPHLDIKLKLNKNLSI